MTEAPRAAFFEFDAAGLEGWCGARGMPRFAAKQLLEWVYGKGVVDVDGCLAELKRQKFDGHISVEHEADWDNSVPQVKHNIDFVKERAK